METSTGIIDIFLRLTKNLNHDMVSLKRRTYYGAPWAKPMVRNRRPQGANILYQRTNSPMGRTRGPLGSG